MDSIRSIKDFKTNKLVAQLKNHPHVSYFKYDDSFDALILLFVPPETETVVHYLDDSVALLVQPDDLEIVGLQIEDFEYDFLPKHEGVRKVWKLSDSDVSIENVDDLVFIAERKKKEVLEEVFKSTEDLFSDSGLELTPM